MNSLIEWFFHVPDGYACATSILTIIGIGVAAAGVATSASSAKKGRKANKENQEAFNDATRLNEEEARKIYDDFIKQYNSSKEKLNEGLTLQEYISNMVKTLDNPQLTESYRRSRNGDWEQAQRFADQANEQNISAFNMIVDNVSGGDYKAMVAARNKAVLGEDVDTLYEENRRLRNPKIPEGSIKKDAEGNVIGGQRGDKFEFQVSTTTQKEFNDRSFAKSRTAIEDDRAATARQQDKAINFLPFLNYSEFAANNVVRPFQQNQLAAQLAELQIEAGLASNAMGAAFSAPMAPPIVDTSRADAATAQATQQTVALLADLYKTNRTSSTTATTTRAGDSPGYFADGTTTPVGANYS